MTTDDTLITLIAAADPVHRSVLSDAERRVIADRAWQRVIAENRSPARSRPGIGAALMVAACLLVMVAVGGAIVIGHGPGAAARPAARTHGAPGTFALLVRPRTPRDRLPVAVRTAFGARLKLDYGRSVLLSTTGTERQWVVPTAKHQLCLVEAKVGPGGRFDGGSEACGQLRDAEIHGLNLGIASTSFAELLPVGTSAVTVTFKHGITTELRANANGIVRGRFSRPFCMATYIGPTGVITRLSPSPARTGPAATQRTRNRSVGPVHIGVTAPLRASCS